VNLLPGPIATAVEGTPIADRELELRRLSKYPPTDQSLIVSIIKGGEAESVNGAVESIREGLARINAEPYEYEDSEE
jgi:hypothetical protein